MKRTLPCALFKQELLKAGTQGHNIKRMPCGRRYTMVEGESREER